MLQLKIGLHLASLQLPFTKALHTAAQLGVDGVEFDLRNHLPLEELSRTGVRHIRKMLDDANLRVAAAAFPTRRGYDSLDQLDRRVDATKRAMQLAWDLGSRVLVNEIGFIGEEGTPGWNTLTQVLDDLGRHGLRTGVTLCAKLGRNTPADFERLFAALPEGSLGFDFDPAEMVMQGYAPHESLQQLGRHVRHFRAHDAVRDLSRRVAVETPLGRGGVEFPLLFAILEQHEYAGYVTLQRQESNELLPELTSAVQYLKRL